MAKQSYFFKPTTILSQIYKAEQCSDLEDCEIAIAMVDDFIKKIHESGHSVHRSIYTRKFSLEKKYKKLFNKTMK